MPYPFEYFKAEKVRARARRAQVQRWRGEEGGGGCSAPA